MKQKISDLKSFTRQKAMSIFIFGYALAVGTSVPVLLSRCSANCLTCGSCALFLGILPLVFFGIMKGKARRMGNRIASLFRSNKIRGEDYL